MKTLIERCCLLLLASLVCVGGVRAEGKPAVKAEVRPNARLDTRAPEDTVRAFYTWVIAHPSSALPAPRTRAPLMPLLSPELARWISEAMATEARCVKAAPKNEKPLIVEGDIFVGNYEGASEVAYGALRRDGEVAEIEADLMYVDRRHAKAHRHRAVAWKDTLDLRLVGERWLVQNVRYAQGNSLSANLQAYIAEGARVCGAP